MKSIAYAELLTPFNLMLSSDRRIWFGCESWIANIPRGKPTCLLCDFQWKKRAGYEKTLGAFYCIVTDEQSMVAGVCVECLEFHAEETHLRCFEETLKTFPDEIEIVSQPHETKQ